MMWASCASRSSLVAGPTSGARSVSTGVLYGLLGAIPAIGGGDKIPWLAGAPRCFGGAGGTSSTSGTSGGGVFAGALRGTRSGLGDGFGLALPPKDSDSGATTGGCFAVAGCPSAAGGGFAIGVGSGAAGGGFAVGVGAAGGGFAGGPMLAGGCFGGPAGRVGSSDWRSAQGSSGLTPPVLP